MLIDLQLHSTYSDGYLTPTKLAEAIAKKGVKIAALTDHNTVGGIDEFREACKKFGIKVIPGLELYVNMGAKKFNLLWFNFNENISDLHNMLRDTQIRRRGRMRAMLKKLSMVGFKIDVNAIIDKYNHYVPDNRVIDDILKTKANKDKIKKDFGRTPREEEIIRAYFFNGQIGRLYETYVDIAQIIKLRKRVGGQLILNHPGKYNQLDRHFLKKIKSYGIDGIEVLSPHHTVGAVMYAQYVARGLGFIMAGGSDFHKYESGNGSIHSAWEYFNIDSKLLLGVEKIIGKT